MRKVLVGLLLVFALSFTACAVEKAVVKKDAVTPQEKNEEARERILGYTAKVNDRKAAKKNVPIQQEEQEEVVLTGDSRRTYAIYQIIKAYWGNDYNIKVVSGNGHAVTIAGPGGMREIPLSEKLLRNLERFVGNPRSGESLNELCAGQATLLRQAMGPIGIGEPKGKPTTQGKCRSGKCYGHAPSGDYRLLGEIQGVRLMLNNGNANQPDDCITGKALYKNGQWIPIVTVRNTEDHQGLIDLYGAKLAEYATQVAARKINDLGKEGDSCHEVFLSRDGKIIKGDIPSGLSIQK